MSPKKKQILYQLEKLHAALIELSEYYPNSQLFLGAQIQRLDVIAQSAGVPWERNAWLQEKGSENEIEL